MLKEYLSSIANKFRDVLGTTKPINAQDFVDMIEETHRHSWSDGMGTGYNQGLEEGTEQGKPLGKLELLQDSEYMNAKVSGTAIAVNDVSPIEHSVGCKLELRNLYDNTRTDWGVRIDGYAPLPIFVGAGNTVKVSYETDVQPSENNPYLCVYTENIPGNQVPDEYWLVHQTIASIMHKSVTLTATEDYIYLQCAGVDLLKSGVGKELKVEITSISFTDVEVSRYGKNLFDIDTVLPSFINDYGDAGEWIKQSDGSYYKGNVGTGYGDIWFENKANYKGQIAISMASKHTITEVGGFGLTLEVAYTDGTKKTAIYTPMLSETYSVKTFVTDANKTVFRITQSYNSGKGMYVKDVMIAYGSDTSYEPYIEPTTYQSTADGTVGGVKSISPNMTLLTNNNGVVINANYLRDIDTYIDNLITNVALTGGE